MNFSDYLVQLRNIIRRLVKQLLFHLLFARFLINYGVNYRIYEMCFIKIIRFTYRFNKKIKSMAVGFILPYPNGFLLHT